MDPISGEIGDTERRCDTLLDIGIGRLSLK